MKLYIICSLFPVLRSLLSIQAWVSGELARAWGNEEFGQFVPPKELCLAAEQHDIGWLLWEQAPTLNPETGYPYRFTELP